jgi:hypothetical protein
MCSHKPNCGRDYHGCCDQHSAIQAQMVRLGFDRNSLLRYRVLLHLERLPLDRKRLIGDAAILVKELTLRI